MEFILRSRNGLKEISCVDCGEWSPLFLPLPNIRAVLTEMWDTHIKRCPAPPRSRAADGMQEILAILEYEQARYLGTPTINPYANLYPDWKVPPNTIVRYEEPGKVVPHPELTPDIPITEADAFRAEREAEAILHLNFPLLKHTKQGCRCRDCEARFLAGYELFVSEFEAGEKGAPENYNPETAQWKSNFPKKDRKVVKE